MRPLRSKLVVVAAAGAFAVAAPIGCSADGGADAFLDQSPQEPSNQALPPGSNETDPPIPEEPEDAGQTETGVDAGPPAPTPGTACTTIDEIVEKKCGACGKQSTICQVGSEGGSPKWTEYSPCTGELVGGCIPGTQVQEACGMCGMLTKTCTSSCTFTSSACGGQPPNACVPGGFDFTNAGCTTTDTFKIRTCQSNCQYDSFGSCVAPPTYVKVPPTPNQVNYTIAKLVSTKTIAKLTGSCPNASISTTLVTPYTYVEVHNDNPKAAVVTIFNSLAPGGTVFKTNLAAYLGTTIPTTEAARKACAEGVDTLGTTSLTGSSMFSSLDGSYALTIPANGKALVYIAAGNAYDPSNPTASTGLVKLNVRTDSLN